MNDDFDDVAGLASAIRSLTETILDAKAEDYPPEIMRAAARAIGAVREYAELVCDGCTADAQRALDWMEGNLRMIDGGR